MSTDIPNVSSADGNAFIGALNARGLCACMTRRQLVQLGTPGPYLPCEYHDRQRDDLVSEVARFQRTVAAAQAHRAELLHNYRQRRDSRRDGAR